MPTCRTGPLADALREAGRLPGPVALEVGGDCPGTIYLRAGLVTHVDAHAVPDLWTRAVRSGQVSEQDWPAPGSRSGSDHLDPGSGTGRRVWGQPEVAGPRWVTSLGPDRTVALLRSVVVDGLLALFDPQPEDLRLHPGARPWTGLDVGLELEPLLGEVGEHQQEQAGLGVDPDLPVALCRAPSVTVTVDPDQWGAVCGADGRASVRDLAWRTGQALFATRVAVERLARAGLCRVGGPETALDVALEPVPEPVLEPEVAVAVPVPGRGAALAPLPVRRPGAKLAQDLGQGAVEVEWEYGFIPTATPDPELISRLLAGIRRLE